MNAPSSSLDEYTLAAFLADTLPLPERARVIRHLVVNAEARAVLAMAQQAREAGTQAPPVMQLRPGAAA